MNAGIFSLSWQNIDDRVVWAQRRVFEYFGLPILQHRIHGLEHGEWMDWVLQHHKLIDVFLFVDVDAFPLNKQAVDESFDKASKGFLFGNAQVSTHIDPNRLFVAPSWCALARQSWAAAGCPSARIDAHHDVGQRWSEMVQHAGVKVEVMMPARCMKPMWKLPNGADYGIGTTFQSSAGAMNFHMFGISNTTFDDLQFTTEARLKLLEQEAERVCRGMKYT